VEAPNPATIDFRRSDGFFRLHVGSGWPEQVAGLPSYEGRSIEYRPTQTTGDEGSLLGFGVSAKPAKG